MNKKEQTGENKVKGNSNGNPVEYTPTHAEDDVHVLRNMRS